MVMVTLAINTASKKTAIALVDGKKILVEKSWNSNNDEAEKLMPEIAKLFKKTKLKYEDLEKVVVIRGPGSFTGLRIGITVANTIAYLQKIPVHSVDTFQYLRVANKGTKDTIVLFAGKKEIYIQSKPNQTPLLQKLDEAKKTLKETLKGNKEIFGELLPDQQEELASKKGLKIQTSTQTFGETILKIPQKEFKKEKITQPLYIKGPGISKPKPIK